MMFENLRVHPFRSDSSKTVAFCSCKLPVADGALYLNNMTLVNGQKGLFLSFPSRKLSKPDRSGRDYQSHFFMDSNLKKSLEQAFIEEYNRRVNENTGGCSGQYSDDMPLG